MLVCLYLAKKEDLTGSQLALQNCVLIDFLINNCQITVSDNPPLADISSHARTVSCSDLLTQPAVSK